MEGVEKYMQRAFELAELGLGSVSPNPLVGCVVVKDGKIIGEGYHKQYGGPHAEVNAINSVKDQPQIEGSQAIVSLEPCSHHGKTPPCADLLINKNVGEVYIANLDPNPLVAGLGVKKLRDAGIKVVTGISEKKGQFVNRRFFTHFNKKRPYIILKWAQTHDGFIARKNFDSKWISDDYSRKIVHKWRMEEDGILVGTNTVSYDNPTLNVRSWPYAKDEDSNVHPTRIVVDKHLKLNTDLNLFLGDQPTICINSLRDEVVGTKQYIKITDDQYFLENLLKELHARNIQSVIIEGGAKTLNSFIEQGLWDEARIFKSKKMFEDGIEAPKIQGSILSENNLKEDTLTVLIN